MPVRSWSRFGALFHDDAPEARLSTWLVTLLLLPPIKNTVPILERKAAASALVAGRLGAADQVSTPVTGAPNAEIESAGSWVGMVSAVMPWPVLKVVFAKGIFPLAGLTVCAAVWVAVCDVPPAVVWPLAGFSEVASF
jgi:hypothetical protein